jgi:APA family basic amino acid/polyamine antiporter
MDAAVADRKWALHRSLGAVFGVAVGVGSMVGVGILRTPGIVLGHVGTPALALCVWLAGAVYVLFCVNYMAELGCAIPRSGGAYSFAQRSLGRVGGVIVGWSDFLNSVYAIALLAVALAEYGGQLIPRLDLSTPAVAVLLIAVFTTINAIGVNLASGTQKLTSLVKLAALWALIGACFLLAPAHIRPPAAIPATSHPFTWLGAIAAFQLVLGAFNGWAAPAYFGGEARGGGRDIARALLWGALLVSLTYVGVNAAVLHVVPTDVLAASKLPAADALERLTSAHGLGLGLGAALVTVLAALSLPSTLQAVTMQTSRTFHAMSQDGVFPRWGARVNRRGAPINAALACGGIAAVLAVTSDFEALFTTFTVFAVLNNLILLCGVVRLRRTEPDLPRPFRIILYPWLLIPIVVVDLAVFAGFAMAHPMNCLLGGAAALVLGVAYAAFWRGPAREETQA